MVFTDEVYARAQGWQLTQRETQVTIEVLRGQTNDAIARKLGISPETVNKHLDSVYSKAEVHSRIALAATFMNLL